MKLNKLIFALAGMVCAAHSHADNFAPYPTPGVENKAWKKFVAQSTGPVVAYFVGSETSNDEHIRVAANGAFLGGTGQSNRQLKYGNNIIFGHVNAGDVVSIFLSIPEKNAGVWSQKLIVGGGQPANSNGVYVTPFSGDPASGIPTGVYVGFEDQAYQYQGADFDYNDSAYVFTNLIAMPD
ncbi:MAG: hypothetical protein V4754_05835 [Pseudomonadota bacterium]